MIEGRVAYLAAIGGYQSGHKALDDFDVLPVRHCCVCDVLVVQKGNVPGQEGDCVQ